MKKMVAIGRKYPEYHTMFETVDLQHAWPRPVGEPDVDYDLLRKVELESSDSAENGV